MKRFMIYWTGVIYWLLWILIIYTAIFGMDSGKQNHESFTVQPYVQKQ